MLLIFFRKHFEDQSKMTRALSKVEGTESCITAFHYIVVKIA
jgi:hypothetical protein